MRNKFVEVLLKKVEQDAQKKIMVLTGDLGFSVLEPLRAKLGDRFINVGINEALLASSAAGLASEGFQVYIYSIAPFVTFRCLEQIRNDICYHKMNVKIIGVGAGYGYGGLGPTHHAVEDVAALWSLPNLTVYSPADLMQTEWAFEDGFSSNGPTYYRIGKGGEGVLGSTKPKEVISGVFEYGGGKDLTVLCSGHILEEALAVQARFGNELEKSVQILSFCKLKPFPKADLTRIIQSKNIVALDELNPYGGFSAQIGMELLKQKVPVQNFNVFSAKDEFSKVVGSYKFQRKAHEIDAEHIFKTIT